MSRYGLLLAMLALFTPSCVLAQDIPPSADPLTVTIHLDDAERFARLFERTSGRPSAVEIQEHYLDGASYGVKVFTPGRIRNAERLAAAVAKDPEAYRKAIRTCLPIAKTTTPDLRSIYLGLRGLYPDAELPQIYFVFGGGNSGGTAGRNAQVLGLEVLCSIAQDETAFRTLLRQFYAHETVHTLQQNPGELAARSPLLASALMEGGADFITSLVTGQIPDPARNEWAMAREAELWARFQTDLVITRGLDYQNSPRDAPGRIASDRWIGNYQRAPEGWPHELGYWIGMRIWQAYFQTAPDKRKAVRDMLEWKDPEAILKASGYAPAPPSSPAS